MTELLYLACPYSHPDPEVRRQRFHTANKAAALLIAHGYSVFSPISHSHPIAEDSNLNPNDPDLWTRIDLDILQHCTRLLVLKLPGCDESFGIVRETQFASSHNIPIAFVNPETLISDVQGLFSEN